MASVIRLVLRTEGGGPARSELERTATAAEGAGSRLRQGLAAGAVAAGVAMGALAAQAISGARESAQIHRVLESQIKNMGAASRVAFGGATKFAEDYGKAIGKDDDDILKVINKLSTFPAAFKKGSLGAQGMERATKAAFNLQATGMGSAESNIVAIGKAMDNPIKGLGALNKSGVSFTAEQQKQIKAYTQQGKLGKAQEILLQGIEANAKKSAEAAVDGMTRGKVAFDDFAEKIGSKLLPYLNKFGDWFSTVGIPKLEQFGAWFGTNVAPKIGAAFDFAKGAAEKFVGVLSNPAVQAFAASIGTVVAGLKAYQITMAIIRGVTVAWTAVQWALNVALTANPIGLVILAIAALVAGIIVAYKRSATFRAMVQAVGRALLAAGKAVVEFVTKSIKWVKELPDKIKAAFSSAKTILLSAGSDVIGGFWQGLKNRFSQAKQWLVDQVNSLPVIVKKILRIGSPSRVFKLIGLQTGQGWGLGLAAGWRKYGTPAIRKMTGEIADQLIAKAKAQTAKAKETLNSLITARNDYARTISENLRGGGITSLVNLDGVSATARTDTVIKAYQDRLAAIRRFAAGINTLGRKGIGTSLLQQLVAAGPDQAAGLVDALRGAAPAVLQQIRSLDALIAKESATFGAGFAGAQFAGRIATAQQAATKPVQLVITDDGTEMSELLVKLLRKSIRAKGGNVQVVLGGAR